MASPLRWHQDLPAAANGGNNLSTSIHPRALALASLSTNVTPRRTFCTATTTPVTICPAAATLPPRSLLIHEYGVTPSYIHFPFRFVYIMCAVSSQEAARMAQGSGGPGSILNIAGAGAGRVTWRISCAAHSGCCTRCTSNSRITMQGGRGQAVSCSLLPDDDNERCC